MISGLELEPLVSRRRPALILRLNILATDVPDDYIVVQSGVGQAVPNHILVVPLQHEHRIAGVLELGAFHEFTPVQVEFLEKVAENIAITIHAAHARNRMTELLEKTQRQSEALEQQQEELRAANEELEEQTQQLRRSEERLKSQQEELEMSNAQLEEKTVKLEEQKQDLEKSWNQTERERHCHQAVCK